MNQKKVAYYLEDDFLVRMVAKLKADEKKLELNIFPNSKCFLNAIKNISKQSILFLDSDIGEEIRGEKIGKQCFEMGFKTIYLITNYEKEDFKAMFWIKDIGSKEDIFKFWNNEQ